jgi:hypothetical protein
MSVSIYAFLGARTEDLQPRFIQAFGEIGFRVELHPDMTVTQSNQTGSLYLAVLETPAQLQRLAPGRPLLAEFGYGIQQYQKKTRGSPKWPPRKVGQYSYEAGTRTSAGRSTVDAAMQTLSMAILAKITDGYFYGDGDATAVDGEVALAETVKQLAVYEHRNFDAYARPFEQWPPLDQLMSHAWPSEIVPDPIPGAAPGKRRFRLGYKFSIFHIPGILLLLYWFVISVLFS